MKILPKWQVFYQDRKYLIHRYGRYVGDDESGDSSANVIQSQSIIFARNGNWKCLQDLWIVPNNNKTIKFKLKNEYIIFFYG